MSRTSTGFRERLGRLGSPVTPGDVVRPEADMHPAEMILPKAVAPPRDDSTDAVSLWLTNDFIASFQRDVDPTLWTDVEHNGAVHHRGFFAIVVLTLAYCDAMAGLVVGQASSDGTEATVKFIENEVAPNAGDAVLSDRYKKRAAALIHMYRHGPVHQREPALLRWDGVDVAWSVMRGDVPAMHLKLTTGAPWFYLHVGVDMLNAHVLRTFEAVRDRVRGDAGLARNIFLGATQASTPQTPACGPAGHVGTKLSAMVKSPDL